MGTCLGRKTDQEQGSASVTTHDRQDFAPIKNWAVIHPRPSALKAALVKGTPIPTSRTREPSYPAPRLSTDPTLPPPLTCLQLLITMQKTASPKPSKSPLKSNKQHQQVSPRQFRVQRQMSPESDCSTTHSVAKAPQFHTPERRFSRSASSSEMPERTYSFSTVSSEATSSGSIAAAGSDIVSPPKYAFPLSKTSRRDDYSYAKGKPACTAGEFLGRIKKGLKQPQQRQESRGIELVKGYKGRFSSWGAENESLLNNPQGAT